MTSSERNLLRKDFLNGATLNQILVMIPGSAIKGHYIDFVPYQIPEIQIQESEPCLFKLRKIQSDCSLRVIQRRLSKQIRYKSTDYFIMIENLRRWTSSTSARSRLQKKIFLKKIMVPLNVLREGDPISRFQKDINRLELYGIDMTGVNDSEYEAGNCLSRTYHSESAPRNIHYS